MAVFDQSITDLIGNAIRDAQELVRSEVALAKAEVRDEVRRLGVGVGLMAGAAVAGVLTLTFLLTAAAWGLTAAFEWPAWAGFALVGVVLLLVTGVLALLGRRRLAAGERLPMTKATMKENAEWLRARTS